MRRYKAHLEQRRQPKQPEPPAPKRCSFCFRPQGDVRMLWGDERVNRLICDQCIDEARKAFEAQPVPPGLEVAEGTYGRSFVIGGARKPIGIPKQKA
jgi:hypothetical protein